MPSCTYTTDGSSLGGLPSSNTISVNNTEATFANIFGSSTSVTKGNLQSIILEGFITIGTKAFENCSNLSSVRMDDSVTTIGEEAFKNCKKIDSISGSRATNLTIGRSVTEIGREAFAYGSVSTLIIPTWVTTAGALLLEGNKDENNDDKSFNVLTSNATDHPAKPFEDVSPEDPPMYKTRIYVYNLSTGKWFYAGLDIRTFEIVNIFERDYSTIVTYFNAPTWTIPSGYFRTKSIYTTVSDLSAVTIYGANTSDATFNNIFNDASNSLYFSNLTGVWSNPTLRKDELASIVLEGFTSIGNDAFVDCSGLSSVTIPDSVTSIGFNAFKGCTSLASVTIPDSVTSSIGDYAFQGCTSLASVTIGDLVTSIGYRAFQGCTMLASVTIGDSVTSISGDAFYLCSSLPSVTIGVSCETIGVSAFYRCSSLDNLVIPTSVNEISEYAFNSCNSLSNVVISSNTRQGNFVFQNIATNPSLYYYDKTSQPYTYYVGELDSNNQIVKKNPAQKTYANIITSNSSITNTDLSNAGYILTTGTPVSPTPYKCTYTTIDNSTQLTILNIQSAEASFSTIFDGVSINKGDLSSIILEGFTSIGEKGFEDCSGLKQITIPTTVPKIPEYGFSTCRKLESITIPQNIESLDKGAFFNCTQLKSVTFSGTPTIKTIGQQAFYGSILEFIKIPSSVEIIGGQAFSGADVAHGTPYAGQLKVIIIPITVTNIYYQAFKNQSNLQVIVISSNTTQGGGDNQPAYNIHQVFEDPRNPSPVKLYYYDMITTPHNYYVGVKGTHNANNINNILKGDGDIIYSNAITANAYITDTDLTDAGYTITTAPNYKCTYTTTTNATPQTIENIQTAEATFSNIFGIGDNAIIEITDLSSIVLEEFTSIGTAAFYQCSNLSSVTIPNTVTTILNAAFGEIKLGNFIIPTSVTNIGFNAFEYPQTTTTSQINMFISSATSQSKNAFSGLPTSNINFYYYDEKSLPTYFVGELNSNNVIVKKDPEEITSFNTIIANSNITTTSLINAGYKVPYRVEVEFVADFDDGTTATPTAAYERQVLQMDSSAISFDKIYEKFSSITKINLQKVSLLENITSIINEGFIDCSGLYSFNVSTQLETIGNNAFEGCNFNSIDLTTSPITNIGKGCFKNCNFLREVNLPTSITQLQGETFLGCGFLETIVIPTNYTSLGNADFSGNTSLHTIIMSSNTINYNNSFNALYTSDLKHPDNQLQLYYYDVNEQKYYYGNELTQSYNFPSKQNMTLIDSTPTNHLRSKNQYWNDDNRGYSYLTNSYLEKMGYGITFSNIDLPRVNYTVDVVNVNGNNKYIIYDTVPADPTSLAGKKYNLLKSSGISLSNPSKDVDEPSTFNAMDMSRCGIYVFTGSQNVSQNHPFNLQIADGNNKFDQIDTLVEESIMFEGNSNFYTKMVVRVKGDFDKASLKCKYHGYMGAENIFSFNEENTQGYITRFQTRDSSFNYIDTSAVINNIAFDTDMNSRELLTEVIIPDGVTKIGPRTKVTGEDVGIFNDQIYLEKAILPNSITSISPYTFMDCHRLKKIVLPSTASQGLYAFKNCSKLQYEHNKEDFVYAINNFYNGHMNNNDQLQRNSLDSRIEIGDVKKVFTESELTLAGYTLPTERPTVDVSYVLGVYNPTTYSTDNTVYSFKLPLTLDNNTKGEITENVIKTHFPHNLVQYNQGPSKIWIPKQISKIGANAFYPQDTYTVEGQTYPVSNYLNIVKFDDRDSNLEIDDYAFYRTSLKDISYGSYISKIGKYAFSSIFDINGNGSITLPKNLLDLGEYAFFGSGFTELSVEDGSTFTELPYYSFGINSRLKSMNISNTQVKEISNYAFSANPMLKDVFFSPTLEKIGDDAFSDHLKIDTITFPETLKEIGQQAFRGLGDVKLPTNVGNGLTNDGYPDYSIGYLDVSGSALKTLTFNKSLTTIGNYAFGNNPNLKNIVLPHNLTTLGNNVFPGCNGVKLFLCPTVNQGTFPDELIGGSDESGGPDSPGYNGGFANDPSTDISFVIFDKGDKQFKKAVWFNPNSSTYIGTIEVDTVSPATYTRENLITQHSILTEEYLNYLGYPETGSSGGNGSGGNGSGGTESTDPVTDISFNYPHVKIENTNGDISYWFDNKWSHDKYNHEFSIMNYTNSTGDKRADNGWIYQWKQQNNISQYSETEVENIKYITINAGKLFKFPNNDYFNYPAQAIVFDDFTFTGLTNLERIMWDLSYGFRNENLYDDNYTGSKVINQIRLDSYRPMFKTNPKLKNLIFPPLYSVASFNTTNYFQDSSLVNIVWPFNIMSSGGNIPVPDVNNFTNNLNIYVYNTNTDTYQYSYEKYKIEQTSGYYSDTVYQFKKEEEWYNTTYVDTRIATAIGTTYANLDPSAQLVKGYDYVNSELTSIINYDIFYTKVSDTTTTYSFKHLKDKLSYESFVAGLAGATNINSIETVTLPKEISGISNETFSKGSDTTAFSNLKNVFMVDGSLVSIGEKAFKNCTSLVSLVIPKSVTTLGQNMFENTTSFTHLVLPNPNSTSQTNIFGGTSNIKNAGSRIFAYQDEKFYDSVISYGKYIISDLTYYYSNTNLQKINSTLSITLLQRCGYNSTSSKPKPVEIQGYDVSYQFVNETTWRSRIVYKTDLSNGTFTDDEKPIITKVRIPDGIVSIGLSLENTGFLNSPDASLGLLTSVEFIGSSVTQINEKAFENCVSLQTLKLPPKLERIGKYAFNNSFNANAYIDINSQNPTWTSQPPPPHWATRLILPKSLKYIGEYAFGNFYMPNNQIGIAQFGILWYPSNTSQPMNYKPTFSMTQNPSDIKVFVLNSYNNDGDPSYSSFDPGFDAYQQLYDPANHSGSILNGVYTSQELLIDINNSDHIINDPNLMITNQDLIYYDYPITGAISSDLIDYVKDGEVRKYGHTADISYVTLDKYIVVLPGGSIDASNVIFRPNPGYPHIGSITILGGLSATTSETGFVFMDNVLHTSLDREPTSTSNYLTSTNFTFDFSNNQSTSKIVGCSFEDFTWNNDWQTVTPWNNYFVNGGAGADHINPSYPVLNLIGLNNKHTIRDINFNNDLNRTNINIYSGNVSIVNTKHYARNHSTYSDSNSLDLKPMIYAEGPYLGYIVNSEIIPNIPSGFESKMNNEKGGFVFVNKYLQGDYLNKSFLSNLKFNNLNTWNENSVKSPIMSVDTILNNHSLLTGTTPLPTSQIITKTNGNQFVTYTTPVQYKIPNLNNTIPDPIDFSGCLFALLSGGADDTLKFYSMNVQYYLYLTLNPLNDTILNFGVKDIQTTLPTGQPGTFTKEQQLAFLYNSDKVPIFIGPDQLEIIRLQKEISSFACPIPGNTSVGQASEAIARTFWQTGLTLIKAEAITTYKDRIQKLQNGTYLWSLVETLGIRLAYYEHGWSNLETDPTKKYVSYFQYDTTNSTWTDKQQTKYLVEDPNNAGEYIVNEELYGFYIMAKPTYLASPTSETPAPPTTEVKYPIQYTGDLVLDYWDYASSDIQNLKEEYETEPTQRERKKRITFIKSKDLVTPTTTYQFNVYRTLASVFPDQLDKLIQDEDYFYYKNVQLPVSLNKNTTTDFGYGNESDLQERVFDLMDAGSLFVLYNNKGDLDSKLVETYGIRVIYDAVYKSPSNSNAKYSLTDVDRYGEGGKIFYMQMTAGEWKKHSAQYISRTVAGVQIKGWYKIVLGTSEPLEPASYFIVRQYFTTDFTFSTNPKSSVNRRKANLLPYDLSHNYNPPTRSEGVEKDFFNISSLDVDFSIKNGQTSSVNGFPIGFNNNGTINYELQYKQENTWIRIGTRNSSTRLFLKPNDSTSSFNVSLEQMKNIDYSAMDPALYDISFGTYRILVLPDPSGVTTTGNDIEFEVTKPVTPGEDNQGDETKYNILDLLPASNIVVPNNYAIAYGITIDTVINRVAALPMPSGASLEINSTGQYSIPDDVTISKNNTSQFVELVTNGFTTASVGSIFQVQATITIPQSTSSTSNSKESSLVPLTSSNEVGPGESKSVLIYFKILAEPSIDYYPTNFDILTGNPISTITPISQPVGTVSLVSEPSNLSVNPTSGAINGTVLGSGNHSFTVKASNEAGVEAQETLKMTSNICFLKDTPVQTDQGVIKIQDIVPGKHTINNKHIQAVTQTISPDDTLISIEKDALYTNVPSQTTIISRNHKVFYNRNMVKASELVNKSNLIKEIPYQQEVLYNILMKKHEKMLVNNLIVETLDPENIVAQLYGGKFNMKEQEIIVKYTNMTVGSIKQEMQKGKMCYSDVESVVNALTKPDKKPLNRLKQLLHVGSTIEKSKKK